LVEAQSGIIHVVSKLGEGSTFSFLLGFRTTTEQAELATGLVEPDAEISGIKVLVVEDIALNQLLMQTLLDDFEFECDIAANGRIAIEKLKVSSYDIILMDLQMPEMNGFETTEYIRKTLNSPVPIIALTADVTTVDLAKCKSVGMNDYLAKPIDERVLYAKLVALLKKPVNKTTPVSVTIKNSVSTIRYTDLTYINRLTKKNGVLKEEMINAYLNQTPVLLRSLKKALGEYDWDLLYAAAHKMIPSFAMVGMDKKYEELAKELQEYAAIKRSGPASPPEGRDVEERDQQILLLQAACDQACAELQEELTVLKIVANGN
jgi:CheY-like chemotaxis protein